MRPRPRRLPRLPALLTLALVATAIALPTRSTAAAPPGRAVVGFRSNAELAAALSRFPGSRIVRRLPHMRTVEVELDGDPSALRGRPGIDYARRPAERSPQAEPALAALIRPGLPYEWQYVAARENEVPETILRAASTIKIAVVDTGADVTHPDLAAKAPETWDIVHRRPGVADRIGHGTFVSALAAGSVSNGEGIAGFGGDAQLLVVKAIGSGGTFSDVDEAAAIVYAVDHGAKIVNLSLGGVDTSPVEQRALEYAAAHDVLLVAAAGNEYEEGNPVEYPAATLQPVGSKGRGGLGLAVGASTMSGKRASFSNTGSHLSLVAPGENVFGALAAGSSRGEWPRRALPRSCSGLYGFSSGTSFASPEVAGAAALVWAANPALHAADVAAILKATASGRGRWRPDRGYGVVDVAAAVAAAVGRPITPRVQAASWLSMRRVRIRAPRRTGPTPTRLRRVHIAVQLRSGLETVTPQYRAVTLQVRRGRRWVRLARTTTRGGGRIRLTVGLRPGRRVVRVVYRGRWDLKGDVRLRPIRVR